MAGHSYPSRHCARPLDIFPIEQHSVRRHLGVASGSRRTVLGSTHRGVNFGPRVWMGRSVLRVSRCRSELVGGCTQYRDACLWLHLSHGILQLLFVHGILLGVSGDCVGKELARPRYSDAAPRRRFRGSPAPGYLGSRHGSVRLGGGTSETAAPPAASPAGIRCNSNRTSHSYSAICLCMVHSSANLYQRRKSVGTFWFEVHASDDWCFVDLGQPASQANQAPGTS